MSKKHIDIFNELKNVPFVKFTNSQGIELTVKIIRIEQYNLKPSFFKISGSIFVVIKVQRNLYI